MQEGVLGITELEMTRLNTRNCPGLKGALGVGFLGELSPNLGDLLSGEAGNRTTVKLLPKKKKKSLGGGRWGSLSQLESQVSGTRGGGAGEQARRIVGEARGVFPSTVPARNVSYCVPLFLLLA